MNAKPVQLKRAVVLLLKLLLYVQLFALFFVLFSVEYPQIINLSRTAATTTVTFLVSGALFIRVYGGYNIGKQKSKPIINSLALAVLFTDLITYFQFAIMNTSQRYSDQIIRFANPGTLVLVMALQLILIVIWTYLGNFIYFSVTPPERACIITSSNHSLSGIIPKIEKFKKQYAICTIVNHQDDDVLELILQHDTVFLYDIPTAKRLELVRFCYDNSKNIYFNPDICDVVSVSAKHILLDDASLIAFEMGDLSLDQRFAKRLLDIIFSLTAILLTLPLMLFCAIAIKLSDRGSVLFKQQRATKDAKVFYIYKFRTMKEGVQNQSARDADDRITSVGKALRKTRLDELPQMFNILKGDMSLVGPRPEMLENVHKYTKQLPEFQYRLRVKAGLTGYAQIMGKYNTSPKDKLFLDLMYIENYSIWMDVKLMLQTLAVFLKSDSTEGFQPDQPPIELVKHKKTKRPMK